MEVFQVKKSSQSRRMAKQKEKTRKEDDKPTEDAAQTRKERVRQLRQQLTQESSDEEETEPQFSLTHRLKEGYIPDANMIYAARKKREIARQLGTSGESTNQNVMLLNSARSKKSGDSSVAKGKSRLIREDDNDKSDEGSGEGGDEGPAMMFGQKTEVSRQMQVLSAMENAESGSDEERFIEQQINKGVKSSVPVSDPSSSASAASQQPMTSIPSIDQSFLFGSPTYPGPVDPGSQYTSYPPHGFQPSYHQQQMASAAQPQMSFPTSGDSFGGPTAGGVSQRMSRLKIPDKLVPITVESLKSRLQNRLDELKETHRSHAQRLERLQGDMATAEKEVVELEEHGSSISVDYQFYQQMRGYLRDLLSCLTEKVCLYMYMYEYKQCTCDIALVPVAHGGTVS